MEFTNSTLNNIKKEAKKLVKSTPRLKFTDAQDVIAKQRGFSSFSDCCKQFYAWLNGENVYVLLRQEKLSHHTYQTNEHAESIPYGQNSEDKKEQQRQIYSAKELNHTQKCGLKLLTGADEKKMKQKFSRFLFNNDSGYFYQLTSFRVPKNKYEGRLSSSLAYNIDKYLSKRVKIYDNCYYEDVSLDSAIYLIDNAFYHADDLYDEDYSDHVMTHDFYN